MFLARVRQKSFRNRPFHILIQLQLSRDILTHKKNLITVMKKLKKNSSVILPVVFPDDVTIMPNVGGIIAEESILVNKGE